MPIFPRAPETKSSVDFVVQIFAVTIATMLIGTLVAVIVIEITNPNVDTTTVLEAETEAMSVLIGALIGYLAGKGHREGIDRGGQPELQSNARKATDPSD